MTRAPVISPASIPALQPFLQRRRAAARSFDAQVTFAAMLAEREFFYLALYDQRGRYGAEPPASHAIFWEPFPATAAGRSSLAARRLAQAAPLDLFGLKQEAVAGVEAVIADRASHEDALLLAARFNLDLLNDWNALRLAERARRVAPTSRPALAYEYMAAAALSSREPELLERALEVEAQVREAMGESWIAAIGRYTERHQAAIRRVAWRARTETEGERFTRFLKSEREFCEDERARAMASFDVRAVPDHLRVLAPLARHVGIGDDPCRSLFVRRMMAAERRAVLRLVEPELAAVDAWLKTFTAGALTVEAEAFFWMLEAIEEMRGA